MISMCFDLSSSCIGITFSQIQNRQLKYIQTLAIIPQRPSAKDLGYTTKEPKKVYSNGREFLGLLKEKEYVISQKEAKKRIAEYKNFSHRYLLNNIGKQLGYYIEKVKPDVIAIEKNASFNGVLTTKLLAEIAGGIYFFAGARGIIMYDYSEATIRAKIRKDITEFNRYKTRTNEIALDTKWEIYCRLRSYFETHYPNMIDFSKMTMDESDSLAVFYHLLTTELH